jgi:gas vesicle protein
MSDRDDFGAFLMGFVVGGLTGAAISLLMAPQSGRDTRELIRDKAIVLRDRASETADEAFTRAEEMAQEGMRQMEDSLARFRERADELQRRGQVMLEQQRKGLGGKIEKATDDIEQAGDQLAS